MRVLQLKQIKTLVDRASKYPDRSVKKAVLLHEAEKLRTKQIQREVGYRPRRKRSA